MTRRDIIIIAVLANMGILAVLFMLAFRPEMDRVQDGHEIAYALEEEEIPLHKGIPADAPDSEESDEDALIDEVGSIVAIAPGNEEEEEFTLTVEEAPVAVQQHHAAPSVPSGPTVQVTVKKGDVLEKIARANGTTVQAIMKANNLKSDKLKIGQVLQVPVGAKHATQAPARAPQPQAAAPTGEQQYYVVKAGDNPWKIAKVSHIKVEDLLRLNNLDEEKARNLKVGDRLRVR